MIDAFKSTLEESLAADLVLLLIDASEDLRGIRIKYAACRQVLEELNADKSKILVVFTKYDRLVSEGETVEEVSNDLAISNPVVISSKTGYGISKLKAIISQHLYPANMAEILSSRTE
jgi:GTP-binding protein HflX